MDLTQSCRALFTERLTVAGLFADPRMAFRRQALRTALVRRDYAVNVLLQKLLLCCW